MLACVVGAASPAKASDQAQHLEVAFEHFLDLEFEDAQALSLPLAEDGHAGAQYLLYLLGDFHRFHGYDVHSEVDREEWLERAANLGHAGAQLALAKQYFQRNQFYERDLENSGDSERRSHPRSTEPAIIFDLVQNAKGSGHAEVHRWLGRFYANGQGVERDLAVAKQHLLTALDLGDPEAAGHLGSIFHSQKEDPANLETALSFYERSARDGMTNGLIGLAIIASGKGDDPTHREESYKWFYAAMITGAWELGLATLKEREKLPEDSALRAEKAAHDWFEERLADPTSFIAAAGRWCEEKNPFTTLPPEKARELCMQTAKRGHLHCSEVYFLSADWNRRYAASKAYDRCRQMGTRNWIPSKEDREFRKSRQ